MLVALITVLGPVSGAHFNPAVTLAEAWRARTTWREIAANLVAQVAGAFVGTAVAHGMFGLSMFSASQHARTGPGQCLGEFVATFGLLAVAVGSSRARPAATPLVVAAWIAAAYWFTSSTSFANPAVTLARAASDTFAGIRPVDVPAFIGAQVLGAFAGACLSCWLLPAVRCAEVRG